jgi:hypothetical protein
MSEDRSLQELALSNQPATELQEELLLYSSKYYGVLFFDYKLTGFDYKSLQASTSSPQQASTTSFQAPTTALQA